MRSLPNCKPAFRRHLNWMTMCWLLSGRPMKTTGSVSADSHTRPEQGPPLWLLAELTYRCPLQCPYCSNPLEFAEHKQELTTAQWIDVFSQARALGAAQLGFSGGEPLVRDDLAELIGAAREMGYYTNLITSGMGRSEEHTS